MIARLMLSALLLLPATAAADEKPTPVWDYMGGGNDDEGWGTLTPDFMTCDTGHNQSPVEIGETKISAMPPLTIHYHSALMHMEKKDRTLVTTMKDAGAISDEGHRYTLEEMRIHIPAEHEVSGKIYAGELQFIHRDAEGRIMIVAIFLTMMPDGNPALQTLLDKAPARTKFSVPVTLNPADFLPKKRGYYAYSGSLTWPPCTEGVEWRIMKEPAAISPKQMKVLGNLLGRNARLLQPLYFRNIKTTLN